MNRADWVIPCTGRTDQKLANAFDSKQKEIAEAITAVFLTEIQGSETFAATKIAGFDDDAIKTRIFSLIESKSYSKVPRFNPIGNLLEVEFTMNASALYGDLFSMFGQHTVPSWLQAFGKLGNWKCILTFRVGDNGEVEKLNMKKGDGSGHHPFMDEFFGAKSRFVRAINVVVNKEDME